MKDIFLKKGFVGMFFYYKMKTGFELFYTKLLNMPNSFFKRFKNRINIHVFTANTVASLGYLHLGFGLAYPSPVAKELFQLKLVDSVSYPLFSSTHVLAMALGSLIASPLLKIFGRKLVIVSNSVLVMLGWMLIVAGDNVGFLIAGRVVTGFSVGMWVTAISVYMGEVSPSNIRGFYTGFQSIAIQVGLTSAYFIGIILSFRWLAVIGIILSLVQAVLMALQPYSPNWLISKGEKRRAIKTLKYLRSKRSEVEQEFKAIQDTLSSSKQTNIRQQIKLITTRYRLKALLAGSFLCFAISSTGNDVISAYTAPILEGSKLLSPKIAALIACSFGLIGSIFVSFVVDKIGRKKMVLVSAIIVILTHFSLFGYFTVEDHLACGDFTNVSDIMGSAILTNASTSFTSSLCKYLDIWPIVSLGMVKAGITLGYSSVGYIIMSEMFPIHTKELSAGVGYTVFSLQSFFLILIFPFLRDNIGSGYTFLAFGILNLIDMVCVLLFIPETKQKTVEEIESLFKKKTIFCPYKYNVNYSYTVNK